MTVEFAGRCGEQDFERLRPSRAGALENTVNIMKDITMAKSTIRKPVGSQQTFSLAAPEASAVQLVGDFTSWSEQPISMAKDLKGVWRVTVTLAPGRHSYRFIADGVWCDDPECPAWELNPYGSQNSVRLVV